MKIGIDIGGSHISVGLINKMGKLIQKKEKDINAEIYKENYSQILVNTIINLVGDILEEEKIDISKIELIGIAVPGIVSNTHIIDAKNLHIKNFDIVSEINQYYNLPIQLRNDAKCAAVAEKAYGSLKKVEDAVFLTLGTGIGGAVFINDNLLRPKKYEGFEIGHMVINVDGIKCNCGRKGCFEKYASMHALKSNIAKELGVEKISSEELETILKEKIDEPRIKKVIDEYIKNLKIGIINLINIFEPETISIGGSFVFYKDILLNKLENELRKEPMMISEQQIPKIVVAKLKNDAGIIGSVL